MKAKTQGSLDLETISAGKRSCFPSLRASSSKARKPTSVLIAEDDHGVIVEQEDRHFKDDAAFDDVEAFLADYGTTIDEDPLSDAEAAEALAVSWKERRQEINKMQKSRQFGAMDASRKAFRIEVEELKRRTRCRKCGRVGHWARECRSKPSSTASSSKHGVSEAASGNRGATETMIAEVVEGHRDEIHFVGAAEEALMSSLVSSPGFGVIDSGCGKTLIGADTLAEMELLLGNRQVIKVPERNSFRFGNGEAEDSVIMAQIPVAIQGKTGVIHATVIRGKAPLLLGRPTLEKLKMTVNFASGTVTMLGDPDVIQLDRNSAD